jgi:hypothetical protein
VRPLHFLLPGLLIGCGTSQSQALPDAPLADATTDAAPAVPDVRFKFVGAFASYDAGETSAGTGIGFGTTLGAYAPVTTGGGDSWALYRFVPRTGLAPTDSVVRFEASTDLSDLDALENAKVVTSLDFTGDAFAVTAIAPDGAVSERIIATVADPTALATFVSAHANNRGFVTTAVGFDGNVIQVVAYAYAGTQTFETMTLTADLTTIGSQASVLAANGYIITAFGRATATTYALVGTRPTGSTAPREVMIAVDQLAKSGVTAGDLLAQGFAIVGGYVDATFAPHFILER